MKNKLKVEIYKVGRYVGADCPEFEPLKRYRGEFLVFEHVQASHESLPERPRELEVRAMKQSKGDLALMALAAIAALVLLTCLLELL